MKQLTEYNSWIELEKHGQSLRLATINELRSSESRNKLFNVGTQGIHIDFSHQRVNGTTLELLLALAAECGLQEKIKALMQGEIVNSSEARPALHTALRTLDNKPLVVNKQDIIPDILAAREKIRVISEQVRASQWLGFSGEPIKDIVNIGIGGSDLGPRFCINALSSSSADYLSYHFVSDVDPNAFSNAVHNLRPETTLFIVSSKSFTTKETLYNAKKALDWLGKPQHIDKHFIAITANVNKAKESGFTNVLPIWDWVGGRYSLCSAISLITAIAIGFEQFSQILAGANSMDKHFQEASFESNLPVLSALMGIWNNNFLHIHNLLILVYLQQLEYFVPYIQQLDMESNGKSIDKKGRAVNYATGPIVWGGLGNQAQHSYYQLLCQGTHKVASDFITVKSFKNELIHEMFEGKKRILTGGVNELTNPNGYIPGNNPLSHISLTDCSPFTLGQLIALYEHKVYTQSVIWDINTFDQPGVESAKRQQAPVLARS
ncbi:MULTISPECIES: glucose-6-phosphate isomerase [unclassified Legionella]|uniref:glucose-6-phosphate isomerase n=1 Tax=unclassified Legionella TaxID=2622702 RepID=UPI001056AABC|nr:MULTISPECIES: glucose-6-phosphate isomerase [unclassified Legionella]MDI9817778.1 glucose-6-phosphate isomerase [Legionella sp. PL877]